MSETLNIDRERLVETASRMIDVPSFTGDEQRMAELMVGLYEELGLAVQWQQVEDGRANALGTWRGSGGGRAGPLHPRLRDLEDLPQQHEEADEEDARADA